MVRIGNDNVAVIQGKVGFSFTSDRTKKENFQPLDSAAVLEKIGRLPLTSWNYIGQDSKQFRHYGPMAQDFYAAFGQDSVGVIGTPVTLNGADVDGIELSAIQQLAQENARLREENAAIKRQLAEQSRKSDSMETRLSRLEAQQPAAAPPIAAN